MIRLSATIPDFLEGQRLDAGLAKLFPEHSRSRWCDWVKAGNVSINGAPSIKPTLKLVTGQAIEVEANLVEQVWNAPENLPLEVIFEDEHILVINKAAGMVVHPAAGNLTGTVLNAVLHHAPQCAQLPRAGIVHRLDKDTCGLMVIAKSLIAHTQLVQQLQLREMTRVYQAVVNGVLTGGFTVEAPIGRHAHDRKKMAVTPGGKPATSHVRVKARYISHSHVEVHLDTGRTHQIRVHMAHKRYPLVGDLVYNGRSRLPQNPTPEVQAQILGFNRQALCATHLELVHPETEELMGWTIELPDDMKALIAALEEHQKVVQANTLRAMHR